MVKAIIIEDEERAASLLEEMLKEIEPRIEVVDTCADLPTGVKSIRRYSPSIVFLDIELPVYSGIQLLDFFNTEEINFHIIFTTAYNDYAVRAFEMSAVDYLMKPIQEDKLRIAIGKALSKQTDTKLEILPLLKQNLAPGNNRRIAVPVANGLEILNVKDICYLKAEGSYTQIFFVASPNLLVSKNLKYFEFILSGCENFLRVHRSFIVNLNFVKRVIRKDGGILCLENKTELPIAEDKLEKVLELLQKI